MPVLDAFVLRRGCSVPPNIPGTAVGRSGCFPTVCSRNRRASSPTPTKGLVILETPGAPSGWGIPCHNYIFPLRSLSKPC